MYLKLWEDPQLAAPRRFCRRCGCECYGPSLVCLRCLRRDAYDVD